MTIQSPVFKNNGRIPAEFTCEGEDINPPLGFSGIPDNAKSLALLVDDPDAPAGTWVHWVVWNIDPMTREIFKDSVPAGGMQGTTSSGSVGYHGPCPPSGEHRYFFKLFALDSALNLISKTTAGELERAMDGHILAQSQLVGLYKKS